MSKETIRDLIDQVNRTFEDSPKESWITKRVARELGIRDDEGSLVQTEHGWYRRVVRGGTEVFIPADPTRKP